MYACVDQEFPALAQVAQKALNTRNHVNNVIGELEVCMTLAETLQDPGLKTVTDWKDLAIGNISSLCALCASYSEHLLEYVDDFGGGRGAPIIEFVDRVSKQFQANINLGETYWELLAGVEFADKTNKYPLVRAALMLTNLTTSKVEDGIGRLLNKTHVAAVTSKQNMAPTEEAEEILGDALKLAKAVASVGELVKPLGRLFVRVALKICDMEKKDEKSKCIRSTN